MNPNFQGNNIQDPNIGQRLTETLGFVRDLEQRLHTLKIGLVQTFPHLAPSLGVGTPLGVGQGGLGIPQGHLGVPQGQLGITGAPLGTLPSPFGVGIPQQTGFVPQQGYAPMTLGNVPMVPFGAAPGVGVQGGFGLPQQQVPTNVPVGTGQLGGTQAGGVAPFRGFL